MKRFNLSAGYLQPLFDMPDMYASIFAAGALGYAFNLLFIMIERRFVHWGGK